MYSSFHLIVESRDCPAVIHVESHRATRPQWATYTWIRRERQGRSCNDLRRYVNSPCFQPQFTHIIIAGTETVRTDHNSSLWPEPMQFRIDCHSYDDLHVGDGQVSRGLRETAGRNWSSGRQWTTSWFRWPEVTAVHRVRDQGNIQVSKYSLWRFGISMLMLSPPDGVHQFPWVRTFFLHFSTPWRKRLTLSFV